MSNPSNETHPLPPLISLLLQTLFSTPSSSYNHPLFVTFGLNVRLDLSRKATTKSLSLLSAQLVFEILGESTWTMAVWMIRGDEGVGDIPGVRGGSGESPRFHVISSIDTRTQT